MEETMYCLAISLFLFFLFVGFKCIKPNKKNIIWKASSFFTYELAKGLIDISKEGFEIKQIIYASEDFERKIIVIYFKKE